MSDDDKKPLWFRFSQNNTGGFFTGPATEVFIEAHTAEDANRRAEEFGLYFDGEGDCTCCGCRWYEAQYDSDGEAEEPMEAEVQSYLRSIADVPFAVKLPLGTRVAVELPPMPPEKLKRLEAEREARWRKAREEAGP